MLHPPGSLPSVDEMLSTLDAENSSHSKTTTHTHRADIGYNFTKSNDSIYSQLTFTLGIPMTHESMDYQRSTQVDTLMKRNKVFINPGISFNHEMYKKNRGFSINYNMDNSAPGMTSLLNIRDDSNPLYITSGNPNLKNTRTHNFYSQYRDKFGKMFFNTSVNASLTENAVASGYIYNKETGVRTVTPDNVNGNWSIGANMMGNLSNVQRYVNAQGRTETFNNVIPSYGILHAIYRLNIQPKKKGAAESPTP